MIIPSIILLCTETTNMECLVYIMDKNGQLPFEIRHNFENRSAMVVEIFMNPLTIIEDQQKYRNLGYSLGNHDCAIGWAQDGRLLVLQGCNIVCAVKQDEKPSVNNMIVNQWDFGKIGKEIKVSRYKVRKYIDALRAQCLEYQKGLRK